MVQEALSGMCVMRKSETALTRPDGGYSVISEANTSLDL